MTKSIQLLKLPEECLLEIFSFLDSTTLGKVARVCKRCLELSSIDALWKGFVLKMNVRPFPDFGFKQEFVRLAEIEQRKSLYAAGFYYDCY